MSRKIIFLILLGIWTCGSVPTLAETAPAIFPGWALNPDLHLNVTESTQAGEGFVFRASNDQFEINVRGVAQKNAAAAKQMAAIEFANIKNLYSPHANPYRGQITALVQCGPGFSPQTFDIKIGSTTVKAMVAGANARKNFGTCAQSEIIYWAEYFNFYDVKALKFVEVRFFEKRQAAGDKGVKSAVQRFQKLSEKIFIEATR